MAHNYCYIIETYDTPAEHINPSGDVIGALLRQYRDELGIINARYGGIYEGDLDDLHGDCCQGFDFPEDFGVDGMLSEDAERTRLHIDEEEPFVVEPIEEFWYTLMDFEIDD